MPSIEKRVRDGNVTWRAHYRTPEGKQRNRSFARKIDAERFLTTVQASKMQGTFVDPSRGKVTVEVMAQRWTESKVNLKASTRAVYAAVMDDHVLPRWRDVALTSIEHEAVQAWVAELVKGGHSGAHVRKIVQVFSSVLDLAVRGNRLSANPARGVELPRAAAKPKKYLSPAQVEVMAVAAGQVSPGRARPDAHAQYRLAVLVLAYCGLRWSELAALRVSSLDARRRRLTVSSAVVEVDGAGLVWGTPKSHEARAVPVEADLCRELTVFVEGRDPGELLFTAPDGGVLRNRNARRGWFNAAALAAGAPGLTPHELRHTAASLAVSAGANVKAVQRMLGHASAAITLDIYTELFDDDLEAVGARLSALRAKARVARALPEAVESADDPAV